jgi:hypothetical protein
MLLLNGLSRCYGVFGQSIAFTSCRFKTSLLGKKLSYSCFYEVAKKKMALYPKYLVYPLLMMEQHTRLYYLRESHALHVALAPINEQKEIVGRIEKTFSHLAVVLEEFEQAEIEFAAPHGEENFS